jgi:hypothetical protein
VGAPLLPGDLTQQAVGYGTAVTVLQTIGVYVLIPIALYGVIALFTMWPRIARGPRYRPGQEWPFDPVWWTGNPEGVGTVAAPTAPTAPPAVAGGAGVAAGTGGAGGTAGTARGGARGNW